MKRNIGTALLLCTFLPLSFFGAAGLSTIWPAIPIIASWSVSVFLIIGLGLGAYYATPRTDSPGLISTSTIRAGFLAVGIAAIAVIALQICRWDYHPPHVEAYGLTSYRTDRVTGQMEVSVDGGSRWERVGRLLGTQ